MFKEDMDKNQTDNKAQRILQNNQTKAVQL
jgi:hypothetical protein